MGAKCTLHHKCDRMFGPHKANVLSCLGLGLGIVWSCLVLSCLGLGLGRGLGLGLGVLYCLVLSYPVLSCLVFTCPLGGPGGVLGVIGSPGAFWTAL